MSLIKRAARAVMIGIGGMLAVGVLALIWPAAAAAVHALLVSAVVVAVLIPVRLLVARSVALVHEQQKAREVAAAEQSAADHVRRAGQSTTAALRESA